MSSSLHQNYTRRFANELNVPVFSVDYRLAPEHRFPAAVNDCWQAYYWIVNHAKEHLGIEPDKIVLTGDSAGGFLVITTTIMAIINNFQIPTGIVPVYPLVSSDISKFLPSNLCSLDDTLLSASFVQYCMSSFVAYRVRLDSNFLANPSVTPDEILEKFPPCHMYVCEVDPLRDAAFNLGLRLKKLGREVKIDLMQDYIHGFQSFDLKVNGVEEYHNTVGKVKDTIGEFLNR